jgi:hypothetical protein
MKKKHAPDDADQSKLGREIKADEKHSAADNLMERLAKTKPEHRTNQKRNALAGGEWVDNQDDDESR